MRSDSAQEELARARERFQLAARATGDVIWERDLRGGELVWAGDTLALFGLAPETVLLGPDEEYGPWAAAVHPDDLAGARAMTRVALETGAELWHQEYRLRRPDGGWRPILERAFIVRDPAGRPVRVVGALKDVTGEHESERITTLLASIVTSSADAIVSKTLEGVVTSWNAAAERIFGYTEEEMIGQPIFRLIPEELHGAERDVLERIGRGERAQVADAERVTKHGSRIHISLTVSPVRDGSGAIVGASSIKRDITERKRTQEELARREERYRALVTATAAIVWTADAGGAFSAPQASWQQYTGQQWEEYAGMGWLDALHPDDRESIRATWHRACEAHTPFEAYGRLWSEAHQAYRHFIARAAPVRGLDGLLREWVGTVTDAEEHWIVDERLRQAERMESVGRLAGGIAHEANNQMTVVLGAAEFLLRRLRDETAREDVEHIRRAAHRTAAITQQLLAYSRRQLLQPQVLDANGVVTALAPVIERALGETCRLTLRLAPGLGPVKADPGQLDQVLLNLALNARDAMPGGGTVAIETANVLLDEGYVLGKRVQSLVPGMYVMLMVSDTGHGMDERTLRHVFEPFFTTKGVGEGSGLGLSTVYGIVKQSGGFVWVYSEPGHGTAIKIYLPLVRSADVRPADPPPAPVHGGTELVLVAEDRPSVRSIIGRVLREAGYTVLEAADGAEALTIIEQTASPPKLVIADVVMPGIGGKELAERLTSRWPNLPILFISGYTGLDAVSRGMLEADGDFMQKPLEPGTLVRKVREMLDAARSQTSA
jgi:PAS domain S-box-containing protein